MAYAFRVSCSSAIGQHAVRALGALPLQPPPSQHLANRLSAPQQPAPAHFHLHPSVPTHPLHTPLHPPLIYNPLSTCTTGAELSRFAALR